MFVNRTRLVATAVALGTVAAGALVTVAAADGDDSDRIRVRLSGYQEDPLTVSTDASGEFKMWVDRDKDAIRYRLQYAGLEGAVTQAHIHFGGVAQSGGISAWLCQTATNPGPPNTPTCPASGSVSGTVRAAGVIGPVGQGIEAGAFDELLDAIRAQTTYVNVHSSKFPGGEIRSQLTHRGHR